jgi:linoleoyl-CoA desaturase
MNVYRRLMDALRLAAFAKEIDALRARVEAQIGAADVDYIRSVRRWSRRLEIVGRSLIHFSIEPVGFAGGVLALFLHKQIETTEIGHTVLHGTFDGLEGAEAFASETFYWPTPIDEAAWKRGHNLRHHGLTNVAGADADIHFGTIRLNEHTPHRWWHRPQLSLSMLLASHFTFGMSLQFAGVLDVFPGNGRPESFDFIGERSPASVARAFGCALRKFARYYGREYVLFPALAGPFFWKVYLGNWLASTLRDYYTAATIFCGHVGENVKDYERGTRASGRGAWYLMQIEATNNFEVPALLSVLCGGLDRHIEHHLFPRFPTNRLRSVAPELKRLCERYGVIYRTASWPATLRSVYRRLSQLATG